MIEENYDTNDLSSGFLIDGKYRIYPTTRTGELKGTFIDVVPTALVVSLNCAKSKVAYSIREWNSKEWVNIDQAQYLTLIRFLLTTYGNMIP